jgi:hypothetical protein
LLTISGQRRDDFRLLIFSRSQSEARPMRPRRSSNKDFLCVLAHARARIASPAGEVERLNDAVTEGKGRGEELI